LALTNTFGADEADARAHARDALEEAIAARIAQGRDLPLPDARKGGAALQLSPNGRKLASP